MTHLCPQSLSVPLFNVLFDDLFFKTVRFGLRTMALTRRDIIFGLPYQMLRNNYMENVLSQPQLKLC